MRPYGVVDGMRLLVATTRGAGHVGPLIPFARAAQRAGHQVLFAAPPPAAPTPQPAATVPAAPPVKGFSLMFGVLLDRIKRLFRRR